MTKRTQFYDPTKLSVLARWSRSRYWLLFDLSIVKHRHDKQVFRSMCKQNDPEQPAQAKHGICWLPIYSVQVQYFLNRIAKVYTDWTGHSLSAYVPNVFPWRSAFLLIHLQIFILHSVCFQQFITILLNVNSKLLLRSLDIKVVHDNSLYWFLEFVHVVGTEVGRMIKIQNVWFICQIVCLFL